MRERVGGARGRRRQGDVGHDLPLRLRADAALGRRAAGLHARLHDLRRGGLGAAGQAAAWTSWASTPSASRRAAIKRQISDAKNQLLDAEAYRLKVELLLRADRGRRLRALRAADPLDERDGLRRPAVPVREPVRALPRGAGPLPALLPARAGGRVPGHQPRPVPVAAAAGGGAPEPGGGGRRRQSIYAFRGRGHPQHPGASSTTSPTPTSSSSSRTTARPRPSSTPPTRSSRTTAARSPSTCGPRRARASRSTCASWRTSTPRRASWRARSSATWRAAARATTWRSSTAPTRRAACSRTRWCATASATRSSAAPASTSAPRSRTRWRTSRCW